MDNDTGTGQVTSLERFKENKCREIVWSGQVAIRVPPSVILFRRTIWSRSAEKWQDVSAFPMTVGTAKLWFYVHSSMFSCREHSHIDWVCQTQVVHEKDELEQVYIDLYPGAIEMGEKIHEFTFGQRIVETPELKFEDRVPLPQISAFDLLIFSRLPISLQKQNGSIPPLSLV